MSAFVVDKAHINALVNAGLAVRYKPMHWYDKDGGHVLQPDNADEVGQMLLDECIRSVGYRYQNDSITTLPGRSDAEYILLFKFKLSYDLLPPVVILKLISCYEYQSCETDDWKDSEAYAFCQALRSATISRLPGYDEAPWEFTEWPQETLRHLTQGRGS